MKLETKQKLQLTENKQENKTEKNKFAEGFLAQLQ